MQDPFLVSPASARADDAFDAERYLAQLPFVDGMRIAVIGWSHGGMAVLFSARKKLPDESGAFKSAVASYLYCITYLKPE